MRLLVAGYKLALSTYFRFLKVPLSRLVDLFRPHVPFRPPDVASLEDYHAWAEGRLRWKLDPLWGIIDLYPSLEFMSWQLDTRGVAENDCDGLAYFSAAAVRHLADSEKDVYVVTIVLDPRRLSLLEAAHVITILRAGGKWRVISNAALYPRRYNTFHDTLLENPYTRGQTILFLETRDADLKPVSRPAY